MSKPHQVNDRSEFATAGTTDPTCSTDQSVSDAPSCPRTGWQLILVPLAVTIALVAAGLAIGWLVSPSPNPSEIIRELATDHRGNWRKALVLANVLRDPQYAQVRRDEHVARQLSLLLDAELETARMDTDHIQLRIFLCRALGEFETARSLPMLIRAGQTQRDAAEIPVRRSAVQATSVLVSRLDSEFVCNNDALVAMAVTASKTFDDTDGQRQACVDLRGSAAFLLGVLGSEPALARLVDLLQDPATDVRFNAATGLARFGRSEAIPVLVEMLDAENLDVVAGESTEAGRHWKRALVVTNAFQAVEQIAPQLAAADLERLVRAMEGLIRADVSRSVQVQAQQKLQALKALQAGL